MSTRWVGLGLLVVIGLSSTLGAAERLAKPTADDEVVDVFAGVAANQLEVKVIARDEKQARIFITNKTKQPLNVRLPDAFAARPILAQFNNLPLGGNQPNNGQQANQPPPQTFGGPTNNNQMNNRRGFFNIPPEQTRDVKVAAVCLEHGKPNPRPQHAYELLPLASYSSDPALAALMQRFGDGKCSQRVAQAAAWHLASGRTWDQLVKEPGELVAVGTHEPYFTKQEIEQAKELVTAARRDAQPAAAPVATTARTESSAGR